jgi:hypothetical protein
LNHWFSHRILEITVEGRQDIGGEGALLSLGMKPAGMDGVLAVYLGYLLPANAAEQLTRCHAQPIRFRMI